MKPASAVQLCITLLYREIKHGLERSTDLVKQALEDISVQKYNEMLHSEQFSVGQLKDIALKLAEHPADTELSEQALLDEIELACGSDNSALGRYMSNLSAVMTDREARNYVLAIIRSLKGHVRERSVYNALKKTVFNWTNKSESPAELNTLLFEHISTMEGFLDSSQGVIPGAIAEVDLTDKESLKKAFSEVQQLNDDRFIYKTGLQGLNDALQGGLRPGDFVCSTALQHMFKTGTSLFLPTTIALFNQPHLRDPSKKPLILRITNEDPMTSNLQGIYNNLKEWETGEKSTKYNLETLGKEELEKLTEVWAEYIIGKFSANGWHFKIHEIDPSEWTYKDFVNLILKYEAEGFEVILVSYDYLSQSSTKGCEQGAAGTDLKDLFKRHKNFCKARRIIFHTPHQLSTEATQQNREGVKNLARAVGGKSYTAGSKMLDREFDIEISQHLHEVNGETFIEFFVAKHRRPTGMVISKDRRHFFYQLHPVGNLRPDFNGEKAALKTPGGGAIGSGQETPWWEK